VVPLSFINANILYHKNCTDQELIKISLFRVKNAFNKANKFKNYFDYLSKSEKLYNSIAKPGWKLETSEVKNARPAKNNKFG
jgi:hypothetical protein